MSLQTTGRLGRAVNDARLASEDLARKTRILDRLAEGGWANPYNNQLAALIRHERAAGTPDLAIWEIVQSEPDCAVSVQA